MNLKLYLFVPLNSLEGSIEFVKRVATEFAKNPSEIIIIDNGITFESSYSMDIIEEFIKRRRPGYFNYIFYNLSENINSLVIDMVDPKLKALYTKHEELFMKETQEDLPIKEHPKESLSLDKILDKISSNGIESLNSEELEFLNKQKQIG